MGVVFDKLLYTFYSLEFATYEMWTQIMEKKESEYFSGIIDSTVIIMVG